MRKTLFLTTALLMVATFIYAQEKKEPYKFNFRSIPFGDTLENVLKKVEGAEVSMGDANISEIEHYGVKDYFKGVFYYISRVPYFNQEFVKHFIITYPQWENIKEIHLFFCRKWEDENDPYTLFFVKKILKPQSGHYRRIFAGLQSSISNELNSDPAIWETKFQDPQMRLDRSFYPAIIGQWVLINKRVLLLAHGSKRMTTRPPEILYSSSREWDKYISSCNMYEIEKKKEIEKEGKKAAKDF